MNYTLKIWEFIAILFIHWVADFVCQTDWQAKNKSKKNYALTKHIISYCLVSLTGYCIMCAALNIDMGRLYLFIGITFVCHWITDYFTSRLNSKLYSEGKIHEFFVSIGFDQVLHYVQLILCYCLILK